MFGDDNRSPREVREDLAQQRSNRPVPDRPTPQRHPRDVREQFRKEGLRGQGRRGGDK